MTANLLSLPPSNIFNFGLHILRHSNVSRYVAQPDPVQDRGATLYRSCNIFLLKVVTPKSSFPRRQETFLEHRKAPRLPKERILHKTP
mmetsp:Transcript_5281/g.8913  ORF Transcript_5281/g.8913 Transcript_5281/m.8913 type:complete len:88 (+) Transcript_5281:38-301(+)